MTGLFHTLGVGSEGLFATRQGVDTAGHNIANAQTDGFSRQRVSIVAHNPSLRRGHVIGNGSKVGSVLRAHNEFAERQIVRNSSTTHSTETQYNSMKRIENIYSPELDANLHDEMANFFSALQNLSNFPDELSARVGLREAGKNLVDAFKRIDRSLKQERNDINESILHETSEVSEKLTSIAKLNIRIRELEVGDTSQANDLRDQRDKFIRDLSKICEIHYYEDSRGMITVRGPRDTVLVEGGIHSSFAVLPKYDDDRMFKIVILDYEKKTTRDVTDYIEGGKLHGFLKIRDNIIPNLVHQNNSIAKTFSESFNQIHQKGFGLNHYSEATGRTFFKPILDISSAAQDFNLDEKIMESTDAISLASTPNAPGDNVIGNLLIRLKDQQLMADGTATMSAFYSNLAGEIGMEVVRQEHQNEANQLMQTELLNRREEVAGVSLDEEAASLLRWQTAFTANSKVITTVDEMLETVLSLKR